MKKILRTICLILGIVCFLQIDTATIKASEYWPDQPAVESASAIIMELSTGTILYEKNITDKHYPASITKILTTLIALENSDLNEVVTFSKEAIDNTRGGSSIARDYGEQMTMEYCLYGVMLASANECAYAVAEHVGGSLEGFVEMMNAKAAELGCVNYHFNNPHGLPDENHYVCAYDMALIAKAAYANESFRIITGTARYTIPPTNKHDEPTNLQNHNELLYPYKTTKYVYEHCTGGKTGWTSAANSTLVTFAEKDGMSLVCVVMNVEAPAHWTETRMLFDYAFDNFQIVNIVENETRYDALENEENGFLNNNEAFVKISDTANIVLPKTAEFLDTNSVIISENTNNDVVGSISYTYAGHEVGKADITKSNAQINEFEFHDISEADTKETEKGTEMGQNIQEKDDNKSNYKDQETDIDEKSVFKVQIEPSMIAIGLLALLLLAGLIFGLKKFIDNYYIIRHNLEVRKMRREQFGHVKRERRRRRHRRHY